MGNKAIIEQTNTKLVSIQGGLVSELNALKLAIENKGGTVAMTGSIPSLQEILNGIDTIPTE